MRRRDFVRAVAASTVSAWSRAALAEQSGGIRRIGYLASASGPGDAVVADMVATFSSELSKLGWVDGRNASIDFRWSQGRREKIRANARALAVSRPDVIVAVGGPATADMVAATRTIPIVFTLVVDPVAEGFVSNLSHPGGNVTGFSFAQDVAIAGKLLQLLKEIAPQVARVLLLMRADNVNQQIMRHAAETAAPSLGVTLASAEIRHLADYEREIEAFARPSDSGLLVLSNAIANAHPQAVVALAARYRLPAVYGLPLFARAGGLIAYGADPIAQFSAAARYVDVILRGTKPGDLPVQQPTRYELAINRKTARALGLRVPPLLLARADKVFE